MTLKNHAMWPKREIWIMIYNSEVDEFETEAEAREGGKKIIKDGISEYAHILRAVYVTSYDGVLHVKENVRNENRGAPDPIFGHADDN